jgi:hypothetical protein
VSTTDVRIAYPNIWDGCNAQTHRVVHWDAPAKLYEQPLGVGFMRGGAVYDGTLAGAVKAYDMFRVQITKLFTIGVNFGAIDKYDGGLLTPRSSGN